YTYAARVKVNKSNASGTGALTIESVKVGAILRIDGGNASSGVRKMEITGADESVWAAGAQGTFYLTATASTVVLSSVDNEFCIYGIHVVDKKAAESVVKEDTAYVAPVVTLSETSVVKDSEVTITATIPAATKTTTYSTGKVDSETVPVNADITYNGATVADGKVDTTSEGTLTITASYTVDEQTYTSEAVTLEVTGAFAEQTAEVANNEDTLGLTATEVSSANTDIATAKIEDSKIVITSKSKGNTTITAGDGTNTATIDVTVKANGGIETKLHKYAVIETITWAVSNSTDLSGKSTLVGVDVSSVEGYATKETVTWTDTASKFKYEGASTISVATFMTNLKKTGTECITSGNYAQVVITNNTGKDITLSKLEYTHSISDKNSGYGCQAFYWIGGTTGDGTALAASSYGATSAILTKATASFEEDVVVKNQQSVTIRFAYYGGSNGNKLCALKDVVLSVK
ncbi:MAG: hypothetical protein K2M90_07570, partial [Treponemataceae bacterium]|nr:hypothetical protein [Treponemataceae bacterium]